MTTPPTPDALGGEEERVAAQVDGYLRGESNARPLSDAGVAVADLLVELGMDRADIARMCRERLLAGMKTYAPLNLATMTRILSNEFVAELLDALNYAGMDTVQAEERGELATRGRRCGWHHCTAPSTTTREDVGGGTWWICAEHALRGLNAGLWCAARPTEAEREGE